MDAIKNSINWFEIPVADFERAKLFYSMIYNYEMPEQKMDQVKMGFFPLEQGGIGGAIVQGEGYIPSEKGTLVYLNGGRDLNVILSRVVKAGGKPVIQKTKITDDLGFFAIFLDSNFTTCK